MFKCLKDMWDTNKRYTFEEFYKIYSETACAIWYKIDRHGETFGGFWKYPEGSKERENAFELSREDNGKGLYELPYPKEVILETIIMGCGNSRECVRYSNFICEWVKRKIVRINLVNGAVIKIQRYFCRYLAKKKHQEKYIKVIDELVYLPPNNLLKSGGINFQQAIKNFTNRTIILAKK